jgi:hypothetical protein
MPEARPGLHDAAPGVLIGDSGGRTDVPPWEGDHAATMKHPASRELFVYWESRRGNHPAPDRASFDPAAIPHLLGDTFVLGFDAHGASRFRVAGTRAAALAGRELKGEPFAALWKEADRPHVLDLLELVRAEACGCVIGAASGQCAGQACDIELLLLPFRDLAGTGPSQTGLIARYPAAPPFAGSAAGLLRPVTWRRLVPRPRVRRWSPLPGLMRNAPQIERRKARD